MKGLNLRQFLLSAVVFVLGVVLAFSWAFPGCDSYAFKLSDCEGCGGVCLSITLRVDGQDEPWMITQPGDTERVPALKASFRSGKHEWVASRGDDREVETAVARFDLSAKGRLRFSMPLEDRHPVDANEGIDCRIPRVPSRWVGPVSTALLLAGVLGLIGCTTRPAAKWTIVVLGCSIASLLTFSVQDDSGFTNDASQSAAMALTYLNSGTMSIRWTDSPPPSNWREPIPVLGAAFAMKVSRALGGEVSIPPVVSQDDTLAAKRSILLWVFMCLISVWVLGWMCSGSHVVGCMSAYASWICLLSRPYFVNTLNTEIHAAALVTGCSVMAGWMCSCGTARSAFGFGITLGMLALTKAAALYIGIALVLSMALAPPFWHVGIGRSLCFRRRAVLVALALVGLIATTIPWIARNYAHFGKFEIAPRAGEVLLIRALQNQMTNEEWVGAFWVYGPAVYRQLVVGTVAQASSGDLSPTGRLSRLNDGLPGGFFGESRRIRGALYPAFAEQGRRITENTLDQELLKIATEQITSDLYGHVRALPPIIWRGLWVHRLDSQFLPAFTQPLRDVAEAILGAIGPVCLIVVWLFGVLKRRVELLGMTTIAAMFLGFYAGATHNEPRFTAPLIPVICVCMVLCANGASVVVYRRVSNRALWRGLKGVR